MLKFRTKLFYFYLQFWKSPVGDSITKGHTKSIRSYVANISPFRKSSEKRIGCKIADSGMGDGHYLVIVRDNIHIIHCQDGVAWNRRAIAVPFNFEDYYILYLVLVRRRTIGWLLLLLERVASRLNFLQNDPICGNPIFLP